MKTQLTKQMKKVVNVDPWLALKEFTTARIALGRAGSSIRTEDWLAFKLDHAKARDAVHSELDEAVLESCLTGFNSQIIQVQSQINSKADYLKRPDLGRFLNTDSIARLNNIQHGADLVIIISEGLSAMAVQSHAPHVVSALLPMLKSSNWSLAPIIVAKYGRVAIEDDIGARLHAKMAIILIGERPGLGSSDSLGAYLVYEPKATNTDANRNCISNIRESGLSYEKAAETIYYLLTEAKSRQLSGVQIKDDRTLVELGIG